MSNNKKIPMRKCVGCQEMKSKKEMMRVLKTSEEKRTGAEHIFVFQKNVLKKR